MAKKAGGNHRTRRFWWGRGKDGRGPGLPGEKIVKGGGGLHGVWSAGDSGGKKKVVCLLCAKFETEVGRVCGEPQRKEKDSCFMREERGANRAGKHRQLVMLCELGGE